MLLKTLGCSGIREADYRERMDKPLHSIHSTVLNVNFFASPCDLAFSQISIAGLALQVGKLSPCEIKHLAWSLAEL